MILLTALLLAVAPPVPPGDELFREAEQVRSSQSFRARNLYERAARLGHPGAQAALGSMLFEDGNRTGALRWLKSSAEQGEPRGMLLWGVALFNGDGVGTDRVRGYWFVERAAKAGFAEAESTRSGMVLVMSPAERRAAASLLAPAQTNTDEVAQKPQAPKQRTTKKAPAPSNSPSVQYGGTWQLQLGAFRVEGAAQTLYSRLSPKLAGKQPTYRKMGDLTALLVGPYPNQAEAKAACRELGRSQPCLTVRAS